MTFAQFLPIAVLAFITLLYLWLRQIKQYWSKRNITSDASTFWYFGRGEHLAFILQRIYDRLKPTGERFLGIHLLFQPIIVLLDLDLIKKIFIADFEYFSDRGFYHNVKDDPLSGNIFRITGEPWKRLRAKLTPTFTSGKMKYMFSTVTDVGQRFAEVVTELLDGKVAVLEMRDLCARFTTDVIGSVAFGIECNSLREPKTEFRIIGDKAFGSFNIFVENFGAKYLELFQKLHVKAFPQELIDFYTKIVADNVTYREQNKIRRNDFLDILIELKNTKEDGEAALTLPQIVGQAFVFFIAGFETTSSTMTFCLYELSQNQTIQQRVREDIRKSLEKHNGQLTYECLRDMKYLEQTFAETLRKYPVGPTLKRVTRKNYIIPGTEHIIENGTPVFIPVYAIHQDPAYYPNPTIFDPERFSPTEVQKRHPMAYLPFGAGPRVCIAERFGKMQAMIGLAMLLRHFQFTNSAETPKKLVFDKDVRIFSVKTLQLKVEKINKI